MNYLEKMDKGLLYITDASVLEVQKRARRLTQKLNTMDRSDYEGIAKVVRELLGRGEEVFINPPFYCDYGDRIEIGKGTFINYNCTILDTGRVRIGDYAQIAPNVSIYTAGHPVHPAARNTAYEYGADITIGNNVWIGGNTVICPGVTIGDNCVIGAGSVVTKDIPAWTVAAGNPCRVLRAVTEADRETYYRGVPADPEALAHMRRIWAESDDTDRYPTAP
ncbi:MAG: sugar O-acetyltransferase [Lachnospiraceae bacterium]|nr:sugar O-acetyltransferase [Lachnospiraceae bacterium]